MASAVEEKTILGLDNPMGTDGFEFVEYTAPDTTLLRELFARMGFPAVAHHKRKDVTLHRRLAFRHGLDESGGVLVLGVEPSSPASRAGLHDGDVIIGFDERRVTGIDDLHRVLTEDAVGKSASLGILRRDEKLRIEITPGEAPAPQEN